ncbi:MAG: hypothetical protein PWP24_1979 [Clostridiales bacterium]|nr:hypothetical protein [Clostridiales bacterium]
MIVTNDDAFEGVYLASGGMIIPDAGTTKTCQSAYMNGTFKAADWGNLETGKVIDTGCHNCPANLGYCAVASPDFSQEGPYMPSWEKANIDPNAFLKDHNGEF